MRHKPEVEPIWHIVLGPAVQRLVLAPLLAAAATLLVASGVSQECVGQLGRVGRVIFGL
jgi:hypothetical protein